MKMRPLKTRGAVTVNQRQAGAALILVLMIVALISVVAVTINEQVRFETSRLYNQRINEQAYWYALGGEELARRWLEEAAAEPTIHLGQPWASQGVIFPIDGGAITGRIVDQQACFNVNNLHQGTEDPQHQRDEPRTVAELQFEQLLLLLEFPQERARQLRQRIQDWIDADHMPQGMHGAEDLHYGDREPAHQPPNHPMTSVSELALMMDWEEEELETLKPYLCALPSTRAPINVNTLREDQAVILAAAFGGEISLEQAASVLNARPEQGWPGVGELIADLNLDDQTLGLDVRESLAVRSAYFRGDVAVEYRNRAVVLSSQLLIRENLVSVYSRRYGGFE